MAGLALDHRFEHGVRVGRIERLGVILLDDKQ